MTSTERQPPVGLLLVDKPRGVTSHDVVGRVRAILGTKRVGHAGTLDPMATGLLVVAVGRATKLLGHLALATKSYTATIHLGETSDTDDADGTVTVGRDASALRIADLDVAMAVLTGPIDQVPSAYSAVKIDGRRAYDRARSGEAVDLPPRRVTVSRFERIGAPRPENSTLDVDVAVDCSTGTYVRALARDLGAALGVGGHLTSLRRHTVGPFTVADALDVFPDGTTPRGAPRPPIDDALRRRVASGVAPVSRAVADAFTTRTVDADGVAELGYGRAITAAGLDGVYAAVDSAGSFIALLSETDGVARPVFVWQAR